MEDRIRRLEKIRDGCDLVIAVSLVLGAVCAIALLFAYVFGKSGF